MKLHALLSVLLVAQIGLGNAGSVLFYMPFVSKSMKITFMPIAEALVDRGHEVVIIMPHPTKKPNPKIKEIIVDASKFEEMTAKVSREQLTGQSPGSAMIPIFDMFDAAEHVSVTAKSGCFESRHLNRDSMKF